MSNRYLCKISAMIRTVENLVGRTNALAKGIANRERKVNMGVTAKSEPVGAQAKLNVLKSQSAKKLWK